jgi:hypothetical protein
MTMSKAQYKEIQAMSTEDIQQMLDNWNTDYDDYVSDLMDRFDEGYFQRAERRIDVNHILAKVVLDNYRWEDGPDDDEPDHDEPDDHSGDAMVVRFATIAVN